MADPSLFDRVKSALTPAAPAPAPAPKPNYDANQVAGQGAVGQAQASRTSNVEAALAASGDRKYADGGYIEDQVARRPDVRQAQASEKGWKTGTLSANFQTEHGEGAGPVNPKSISMGEARDVLKYDGESKRYADGGTVGMSTVNAEPMMQGRHNPDNRLPKRAHHKGRGHG